MIGVNLYLYDSTQEANGYRGEDLSDYVLSGAQNTEDITEELDLSEITLHGLPRKTAFDPETKFIIDVVEQDGLTFTYHRVVQEDLVEKPILSDDEYYVHSITLIEPAVVAQKRVVDNIAITYKLKDVSLETQTALDILEDSVTDIGNNQEPYVQRGFGNYVDETTYSRTRNTSFGKYIYWRKKTDGSRVRFVYTDTNNVEQRTELRYIKTADIQQDGNGKKWAKLEIPVPHIMWGRIDGTDENPAHRPPRVLSPAFADIGVASFYAVIIETMADGTVNVFPKEQFLSNSNLGNTVDTTFPYKWDIPQGDVPADVKAHYLIEQEEVELQNDYPVSKFLFRQYTTDGAGSRTLDDTLADNVFTAQFEVNDDSTYSVELFIEEVGGTPSMPLIGFSDSVGKYVVGANTPDNYTTFNYTKKKTRRVTGGIGAFIDQYAETVSCTTRGISTSGVTCAFTTYASGNETAVLEQGVEYTAYNMLIKAIANSDTYFKEDGTSAADLDANNAPYPFYVGEGGGDKISKDTLRLTRVNETFFHQKNLWEIMLEVGKYCHAIPEVSFGKDEKYEITFTKLGGMDATENSNTRSSVMNFRKVDDYISACSSYVDNLVQLGGSIKEKVVAKTESENFVVDNDEACIIVSKPIIELLNLTVVADNNYSITVGDDTYDIHKGDTADLTPYIYEKNIYGLLSVRANDVPNKGIAMYYELGDKVIKGGDYQLPTPVTNPYHDYAFKKIIITAFLDQNFNIPYITGMSGWQISDSPWYDVKVNDFIFEVEYRTKDTARLEHARPDLRSYILASKYDRVPTHKQFNNQQDTLVDSVAFGRNVFGKLIRTGNNNYKETQWCDHLAQLLHKGDLCWIGEGLYYIAKITHIFYPDHIESVVEYSKDYNQLSAIIGIPSEPRFFEISEQSAIDREVAINDYLLVTTKSDEIDESAGFIADIEHTKNLIFGNGSTYLKWALSSFRGDKDNGNEGTFGVRSLSKDMLHPVNAYQSGGTLTYEWDMVDNFSAGDEVSAEITMQDNPTADNAYRTMRAVQYCDKYGKAGLLDFALYGELKLSSDQIRSLPKSPLFGENSVEMEVDIKTDSTLFSSSWLVPHDGVTPITPSAGVVYSVISFTYLTATSNDILSSFEAGQANLTAYLDGKILAATGNAAANGDVILMGVINNDNTAILAYYLYRRVSGSYVGAQIWNNELGEWDGYVYFAWDDEKQEYVPRYTQGNATPIVSNTANIGKSIVLFKDCRETLHFNYNLIQIAESDEFVISPFFFDNNKKNKAKVVVLSSKVNKMTNGYISVDSILAEYEEDLDHPAIITTSGNKIVVDMSWIEGLSPDIRETMQAVAIMESGQSGLSQKFTIAKNDYFFPHYTWYIGAPNKAKVFTNKQ